MLGYECVCPSEHTVNTSGHGRLPGGNGGAAFGQEGRVHSVEEAADETYTFDYTCPAEEEVGHLCCSG